MCCGGGFYCGAHGDVSSSLGGEQKSKQRFRSVTLRLGVSCCVEMFMWMA